MILMSTPDLSPGSLGEVVQWQVGQAGVLSIADPGRSRICKAPASQPGAVVGEHA